MKTIKCTLGFILILSLFHCSSVPKLQKNSPTEFQEVYFQKWNSGIKEGGSGINVFINVKDNSIEFDSIYFRGKFAKLQVNSQNSNFYVGRFKSSDKKAKIVFDIGTNDCVISYISNNEISYYKISNLKEKEILNYPSSSKNR